MPEVKPETAKSVDSSEICVPEPMEISQTPPPETNIELIAPVSPRERTPEKKDRRDKKDREKGKDVGKKRSRRELEDPRQQRKEMSRKGKETSEIGKTEDEVVVVGERNLRAVTKTMPRIPKLSQREPASSSGGSRDPRLSMQKHALGEWN